jgi:D-sedoheptulose 7-phosphate isomerase
MKHFNTITQLSQESIVFKQAQLVNQRLLGQFTKMAEDCLYALRKKGNVLSAGNGGSFADAQHLSAEFTARFCFDRAPPASISLGTNNSGISAISNGYGFEQVFASGLKGIA